MLLSIIAQKLVLAANYTEAIDIFNFHIAS